MTDSVYTSPTCRQEAVDEIMRSGFTTSAVLAVAMAFPLPGEVEETVAFSRDRGGILDYYFENACFYLEAWGKGSCPVDAAPQR